MATYGHHRNTKERGDKGGGSNRDEGGGVHHETQMRGGMFLCHKYNLFILRGPETNQKQKENRTQTSTATKHAGVGYGQR